MANNGMHYDIAAAQADIAEMRKNLAQIESTGGEHNKNANHLFMGTLHGSGAVAGSEHNTRFHTACGKAHELITEFARVVEKTGDNIHGFDTGVAPGKYA